MAAALRHALVEVPRTVTHLTDARRACPPRLHAGPRPLARLSDLRGATKVIARTLLDPLQADAP